MTDTLAKIEEISNALLTKQVEIESAKAQAEKIKEELKELGWDGSEDPMEFYNKLNSEADAAERAAQVAFNELITQAKELGIEV